MEKIKAKGPARSVAKALRELGSRRVLLASILVATAKAVSSAHAQDLADSFIPKTYPQAPYQTPNPTRYNIKIGNLRAQIVADVQGEFNDNVGLTSNNQRSDFSFGPDVHVGFIYPLSDIQLLQFNLGFGYRWFLNSPSLSSVSIDPNSRLDYRLTLFKDIVVTLYDNFQIQTDPTVIAQVGGTGTSLLNFRRLVNVSGALVHWQVNEQLGLMGGYSFTLDRSLNDQFTSIDHDTHSVNGGVFYTFSKVITAGVLGGYNWTVYSQNFQNDGDGYYVGPVLSYKITPKITVDTSVFYSISSFDAPTAASVQDSSSFQGLTYQLAVRHRVNKWISHDVRVSRSVDLGLGNNFTDITTVQYDINAHVVRPLSVNATFAYETYTASGGNYEKADRYIFYMGTNYELSRGWATGLGYSLAWKNSSISSLNYVQNRVTLSVSHEF